MIFPKTWDKTVFVSSVNRKNENTVIFSYRNAAGEERPFLEIYTIKGDAGKYRAEWNDRILLASRLDTIYAATFFPTGREWSGAIDEEMLRANFSLINTEWSTGNN